MLQTQITGLFETELRTMLLNLGDEFFNTVQEIRLIANSPLRLLTNGGEVGLNAKGVCDIRDGLLIKQEDLLTVLQSVSKYSIYSVDNQLKQGFVTLEGGHRLGVTGQVEVENGLVKTLTYINAINLRISHEIIGCSNSLMKYIVDTRNNRIAKTLIVSPPKCGKTTLIRDISRNLSNGFKTFEGANVAILDERSEIGGCYKGIPQNNVGIRTTILDRCPKVEGMKMLLRSMSPDIIVVDEIGKVEDYQAIEEVLCAGVSILSSVHAETLEDCTNNKLLGPLLRDRMFERVIVLSKKRGVGTIDFIGDTSNLKMNMLRRSL